MFEGSNVDDDAGNNSGDVLHHETDNSPTGEIVIYIAYIVGLLILRCLFFFMHEKKQNTDES